MAESATVDAVRLTQVGVAVIRSRSTRVGSSVFGVHTTVSSSRAAAFGLDGNTNTHTEAGKLKVFGKFELTEDVTFPDDVRQTFNPGSTVAGVNVGAVNSDPSTPSNGDVWYNSSGGELKARINGVTVSLGAAGGTGFVGASTIRVIGVGASATLNVNSTSYVSLAFMEFSVDTTLHPFTHYRIIISGASNVGGQTVTAQLATSFATPTVPVHSGGDDLLITDTGALWDSGYLSKDVSDSGIQTYVIALKGSNSTVDLAVSHVSVLLKGGMSEMVLTDTVASKPAAATEGRVFLPSDGFYVERDTGASWSPWGPIYPMTPPVNGDFAWVNQGGASVDTTNDGIYLLAPLSSSVNVRLRKKAAPSTPYTVTIALIPLMFEINSQVVGLAWRQSSDGKLVIFGIDVGTSSTDLVVFRFTSATVFSSTQVRRAIRASGVLFLRMTDDGTNRVCSYSLDGQHFVQIHTVGRTDFLTADEVGFCANDETNTLPAAMTLLSWKET